MGKALTAVGYAAAVSVYAGIAVAFLPCLTFAISAKIVVTVWNY